MSWDYNSGDSLSDEDKLALLAQQKAEAAGKPQLNLGDLGDRYDGYTQTPIKQGPTTPVAKGTTQDDLDAAADDEVGPPRSAMKPENGPPKSAMTPVSEQALAQLAKTRPDLVEAYKAKMKPSQDALADARDWQDKGNYGNVAGKLLNDFNNSQKTDVRLGNRMQDLGKAPTILKADRPEYDPSLINNVTAQGVKRAEEDRNQSRQDFGEEIALQDKGDQRADQDLARGDQATARARTIRSNDPNSVESQAAREYLKQVSPGVSGVKNFDNLTEDQAYKMAPGLMAKSNLDEKLAAHSEDVRFHNAQLAQGKANQADQKITTSQNQAMGRVSQQLESARGSPAVGQAEKDIYAADKANSLANLYGDPNKLSMPQVRLLASEIGKVASGGVPSMHELDGITPNTLTGKMSEITSRFTNKPTPANAAAFVKQYQEYANQLKKDAQGVISDKYGRVIESNKGKLHPDDYQALQDNYTNRFKATEAAPKVMHGSDLP